MKVTLAAAEQRRTFVVLRKGDLFNVTDDAGQSVEVRAQANAEGVTRLQIGDRELVMRGFARSQDRQIWLSGRTLAFVRDLGAGTEVAESETGLSSSIPATVLEILVRPGDAVKKGQRLVLLESMKMVLPVTSPRDARVRAMLCQVGQAIEPGVALVELDGDDGTGAGPN